MEAVRGCRYGRGGGGDSGGGGGGGGGGGDGIQYGGIKLLGGVVLLYTGLHTPDKGYFMRRCEGCVGGEGRGGWGRERVTWREEEEEEKEE